MWHSPHFSCIYTTALLPQFTDSTTVSYPPTHIYIFQIVVTPKRFLYFKVNWKKEQVNFRQTALVLSHYILVDAATKAIGVGRFRLLTLIGHLYLSGGGGQGLAPITRPKIWPTKLH
jgi:hypothetical protein